jgi:hypothetical protein
MEEVFAYNITAVARPPIRSVGISWDKLGMIDPGLCAYGSEVGVSPMLHCLDEPSCTRRSFMFPNWTESAYEHKSRVITRF